MQPPGLEFDGPDHLPEFKYAPVEQHEKKTYHATQEGRLGHIYGIGRTIRGDGAIKTPWWSEGKDDCTLTCLLASCHRTLKLC